MAETPDIFNGKKESDFGVIHKEAANRIEEVADPLGLFAGTVLKLRCDNGDQSVYGNERVEMYSKNEITNEKEFWLGTDYLIPSTYPAVPGWLSLCSVYGPPGEGSSPWKGGEIKGSKLEWQRNGTYSFDTPWELSSMFKGEWISIKAHMKFATAGFVEMWWRLKGGAWEQIHFFKPGTSYNPGGKAETTKLEMQTRDASNNGGTNAAKIMQYRDASMALGSQSIYFTGLRLGTTAAKVEYATKAEESGATITPLEASMPITVAPKVTFVSTLTFAPQMSITVAPKVTFTVLTPEGEEVEPEPEVEPTASTAHRIQLLVPKLKVPLQMETGGFDVVEQDTVEEVAQCVYAIVNTPLGSRIDDVDFGVEDHAFDQLPIDDSDWLQTISQLEPRAEVSSNQDVIDLVDNVTLGVAIR